MLGPAGWRGRGRRGPARAFGVWTAELSGPSRRAADCRPIGRAPATAMEGRMLIGDGDGLWERDVVALRVHAVPAEGAAPDRMRDAGGPARPGAPNAALGVATAWPAGQ